jgi:hypothetical protein
LEWFPQKLKTNKSHASGSLRYTACPEVYLMPLYIFPDNRVRKVRKWAGLSIGFVTESQNDKKPALIGAPASKRLLKWEIFEWQLTSSRPWI